MTNPLAALRRRRGGAAAAFLVGATAALALADSASATTYTPNTGLELRQAVQSANTNPGADLIKLKAAQYKLDTPVTVTDALTITGDPQFQAIGQPPTIDGGAAIPATADTITVNAGVTLRLKALLMTNGGPESGFVAIRDKGNVELDNSALSGNLGTQLAVGNGATATANDSSINDGLSGGVLNNGSVTFNNVTIANNTSGGIGSTGTVALNNSIVFNNDVLGFGIKDCTQNPVTTTVKSIDGDGSCGVGALSSTDPLLDQTNNVGGPTSTLKLLAGSPAINAGSNNPAICHPADQRFFTRTDGQCDIGAYEVGAVRDQTAPTCVVTALRSGPPKQQDVTVTDAGSGLASGIETTPVTGVTISNGTVATPTTPNAPTAAGQVVTATKTNQAQTTTWQFTATDWAGNSKLCK